MFEVRVIINGCILMMSQLLFGLCFRCKLFLAKSTGFVLYKCVLWLQSRSCFAANFCYLTLSSVYWNQGLDFAKFFTPWSCLHCVLWLQSRSCFTAIFVTWLCWACVRTRGLISLKFSRTGLVYTVFCGSRAEVVLRKFLLFDSVERVLEPGA